MPRLAIYGLREKRFWTAIRLLTIVGLPVCIWLTFAAGSLVVLLFERGEFSRADAALPAFSSDSWPRTSCLGRLVSITQTLFYANMDMRTPLIKHRNLYGFTYRTCDRPRWLAWSGRHSDSSNV